ncbi:fasciclin domain-containing protein [Spirosoma taeanense]|uniref:Fasciclin domain-containing protein n=1 Tax=Spirosoma taeanense TaxID=2735870 RepID=A0A6M5Y6A5_9BACT|nr:fasciclin domain-containing protein [Spirosoma taeanense]QJW88966.1 fasciclin domain-containing protein [Spirosoma taeanense]
MKIKQTTGLFALVAALLSPSVEAQTTPAGTATPTTYPQGAVVSDSMPASRSSRQRGRTTNRQRNRDNRSMQNQNSTTNTRQEGEYRQSSSSNGTSINNSNSTNYNSNNVTTAPTGVGSNPNATPPNDQSSEPKDNASRQQNSGATKTGTAEAITGAPRANATPAVEVGSTARNTSVGDFVSSSPNFITLQNALQSADLFDMLKGSGPYTLFAPSNSAFKKLPANVQNGLLEGRNRDALKQLLSYHVVQGAMSMDELTQRIKTGGGSAQLQTTAGGTLTAKLGSNGRVTLTDEQGHTASVDANATPQSNGVFYGIDAVLMSKAGMTAFR